MNEMIFSNRIYCLRFSFKDKFRRVFNFENSSGFWGLESELVIEKQPKKAPIISFLDVETNLAWVEQKQKKNIYNIDISLL